MSEVIENKRSEKWIDDESMLTEVASQTAMGQIKSNDGRKTYLACEVSEAVSLSSAQTGRHDHGRTVLSLQEVLL